MEEEEEGGGGGVVAPATTLLGPSADLTFTSFLVPLVLAASFSFFLSFFFSCVPAKVGEVTVPGVPSVGRETGAKKCDVSQRHALFCEESLRKIHAKDVELFTSRIA